MTVYDYLTLAAIDAMLRPRELRVPACTFVGVSVLAGVACLLVNVGRDTRALVAYDSEEPVLILGAA